MRIQELRIRERRLKGVFGFRLECDWDLVWWTLNDDKKRPATKEEVNAWESLLYLPWHQFNKACRSQEDRQEAAERRRGFTHLPGGSPQKGGV